MRLVILRDFVEIFENEETVIYRTILIVASKVSILIQVQN